MRDGLYRVETPRLCAGFEIRNGEVTTCAPILMPNLLFWFKVAKQIATLEAPLEAPLEAEN